MLNSYKVVIYLQKLYHFCDIMMMAEEGAKSTWEPINYVRLISRFRPDIMTSIRQLEKNKSFCRVGRVFTNGPGDRGSIPGRVIPKTFKIVLDTSLLNIQQYKIRIKGKVQQFRKMSSTLPNTLVL